MFWYSNAKLNNTIKYRNSCYFIQQSGTGVLYIFKCDFYNNYHEHWTSNDSLSLSKLSVILTTISSHRRHKPSLCSSWATQTGWAALPQTHHFLTFADFIHSLYCLFVCSFAFVVLGTKPRECWAHPPTSPFIFLLLYFDTGSQSYAHASL